jgi:hypothetical protein
MSLSTRINAAIAFTQTASPDLGSAKAELALSIAKTLSHGTGNAQADLAFSDSRTLAAEASEDLDLAGALIDAFGNTITVAEVVAVLIEADAANTTNLTVGGASAEAQLFFAAAGDKAVIKPGGFLFAFAPAGWAITATTADDLRIENAAGGSATYRIAVIGRSA